MARKILEVKSTKIDFPSYFTKILEKENSKSNYWESYYDDINFFQNNWEDEYDYYYDNNYWKDYYNNRYHNKKKGGKVSFVNDNSYHKHKSNKKPNTKNKKNYHIVDGTQDYKTIYFYSDINNPDDNTTIFYNLFDFESYLQDEGVVIDETASFILLNNDDIHCCIKKEGNTLKLVASTTYGNLHWHVNG